MNLSAMQSAEKLKPMTPVEVVVLKRDVDGVGVGHRATCVVAVAHKRNCGCSWLIPASLRSCWLGLPLME